MINPTSSRTITVPSDTYLQNSLQLAFPNAQPGDNLDYWIDLRNVTSFSDTVASVTYTCVPTGLTITPISLSLISQTLIVGAYISGGTLGTRYAITADVVFTSGSTFATSVYLGFGAPAANLNVCQMALSTSDGNIAISGSPIINSGTIALGLTETGVSAGTYSVLTVDAYGRVTNGAVDTQTTAGLSIALDAETTRAESAETTLATNITSVNTSLTTLGDFVTDNFTETNAVIFQHTGEIQNNLNLINEETTRAESAESTLTTGLTSANVAIGAEQTRAQNAESGLSNSLTTGLNTVNNALSFETSRAEGVEAQLQSNMQSLVTTLSEPLITIPPTSAAVDVSSSIKNSLSGQVLLTSFTVPASCPGQFRVQNCSVHTVYVVYGGSTICALAGAASSGSQGADTSPEPFWYSGLVQVYGTTGSIVSAMVASAIVSNTGTSSGLSNPVIDAETIPSTQSFAGPLTIDAGGILSVPSGVTFTVN